MEREIITIDATDKKLGRLSTDIVKYLLGKHKPDYQPNVVAPVVVKINNIDDMNISKKKFEEKEYQTYSGYPGGQKTRTMKQIVEKKGYQEILRKAVLGMLPKNKLQSIRINNLKIIQ